MYTWTRILGFIIGLLFYVQVAHSQASFSASLDSTRFLIGDQLNLTLTAKYPKGFLVGEPNLKPLTDAESPVEILDAPMGWDTIQGTGTVILEKTLRITAWDTGYYQIPVIKTPFRLRANVDTLYSNAIPFEVKGIVVDTTQIAPIKTIIREEITWKDYLPYVYQVLALLGVILLISYFMRRAKTVQNIEVPNLNLRRPAYIIAQERLKEVKGSSLLAEGSIKDYYTELIEILRRYLELGYYLPTREATTSGILKQIKTRMGPNWPFGDTLQQILKEGDLVKFANAQPDNESIKATTVSLEQFIDSTKATGIDQSDTYYRLIGNDEILQDAVEAGLEIRTDATAINDLYATLKSLPSYSEAKAPIKLDNWSIPLFGKARHQSETIWLPKEIKAWQQKSISWSTSLYVGIANILGRIPGLGGLLFYLVLLIVSPVLLVLSLLDLLMGRLPFGKGNLVLREDGVMYFKVKVAETNYSFAPARKTIVHNEEEE